MPRSEPFVKRVLRYLRAKEPAEKWLDAHPYQAATADDADDL